MSRIEQSLGKKTVPLEATALEALIGSPSRIEIDMGTGDGAYPYRQAGLHPETFYIGLDSARENLASNASRSRKKPAKGGRPNLIYLIASMESLVQSTPPSLVGRADRLTALFPWGSLLGAVANGDSGWLDLSIRLTAPRARMDVLLNLYAFSDDPVAERLDLPDLDDAYLMETLVPRYAEVGWRLEESSRHAPDDLPIHTSWGRRLALGSRRESLRLAWRRGE